LTYDFLVSRKWKVKDRESFVRVFSERPFGIKRKRK